MWIDKTDIEKRALMERKSVQSYGIKDIFSFVSHKDIHLIRYPFGKDKLLGFSTLFEGKKIIVSNSSEILSREIYTVAHELGHVLYDLEDEISSIKIDIELEETSEDISEARAYYFANCFLMPEDEIGKYIRYELKKQNSELNALDIVRMQLEFQVSYAALVHRLYELRFISSTHRNHLITSRNEVTSRALFKMLDAEEKLLKASDVIEVPQSYLEYVTSNYDNKYIPYSSLERALSLLGINATIFKNEDEANNDIDLDVGDIFEEYDV